jgi:hypothetical protein
MASTYVNDLRLNEMATGDASGSWGTVTNTNLELIGEAFSYGTETIGDADSTLTIADGAADAARSFYLKITSSVDLTTTRIVTLGPNTVSKVWMIENATTGSQVITIKQGSGATINVPNGQVKMISTDGAGSGGAVLDLLVDVDLTGTTTLVNLDVSGAVDIAGDLTLSAGGDGALRFTAASSVKVLDNNAAALVFEEADNAYMTFVTTDGSEAVKFDKALDINAATQIDATVTVGVDDTGYDVKFFGATAGAYMLWDESADDLILGGAAGLSVNSAALVTGVLTANGGAVFNESGADVDFRVESATTANALFVQGSDGFVGIGTSSPRVKLDLRSDAVIAAPTPLANAVTSGVFAIGDSVGSVVGLQLNGSSYDTYIQSRNMGAGSAAYNLLLQPLGGNVGIGTSSPAGSANYTNLAISGTLGGEINIKTGATTWGYMYANSGGFRIDGSGATGTLQFQTNGTERMRIDSSGNVGIGTSSPTNKLDIVGGSEILKLTNTSASGYEAINMTVGTQSARIILTGQSFADANYGTGDLTIQAQTAGKGIRFGTGGSVNQMIINSSGNVGIGTSSPAAKFHVESSDGAAGGAIMYTATGVASGYMSADSAGLCLATDTAGITFRTGITGLDPTDTGTERMRIDSNGALLLKNTVSTGLASGDIALANASSIRSRNAANSAYLNIMYLNASNELILGGGGAVAGIEFGISGIGAVGKFDSSGNLLVGTTTIVAPSSGHSFSVGNGAQQAIGHNGSSSGTYYSYYSYNGSVIGSITQSGTTSVAYNTSSDYRLKTDAQPMVGASDRVLALNPVNFEWISSGERVDGFLAHEAQEIVPECVTGTKDAMRDEEYEVTAAVYEDIIIAAVLDEEGNELEAERTEQRLVTEAVMGTRSVPDMQGIDQSKLVPLLTAALQEALTKIADMEIRLSALEGV